MTNKQPPASIEAEQSVLSGILLDGAAALSKALDAHLTSESFSVKANSQIFSTLLWMHKNGRELTVDVMISELERTRRLEAVGGMEYVLLVSRKLPTIAELPYFIERVRETYVLRRLIETSDRVKELAMNETASVETYCKEINDIISVRHATQTIKTLSEATDESVAQAERFAANQQEEKDIGLTWPWDDFNARFGEKQPGQLIVLAARPSIGKSSIARQDLMHVSDKYGSSLLFSREMPVNELPPLFAQVSCGHSWRDFRKKRLHLKEEREFIDALKAVKELRNLHVFDRDKTLAQLVARTKAFSQIKPIKYLVIDYLQRYDPEQAKSETRDVALGRMCTALKDLAIDLKIPVLLLCQVGRALEREKRDPILSDLRESGNIEADADRVIFLTAPSENKLTGAPQDIFDGSLETLYIEAIQAKGRGDGRDRCPLYLHRPTTTFKSVKKK